MKTVEAREIMKINFDKYTSISINGVLFRGIKLELEETNTSISIIGRIKEEAILSSLIFTRDQVEISEDRGTLYIERIRR